MFYLFYAKNGIGFVPTQTFKIEPSWVKKLLWADAKEMPANDDGEEATMML